MRAAPVGLVLAACTTLPGCIAAALPIVAGGAIAGTQMSGADGQVAQAPASVPPAGGRSEGGQLAAASLPAGVTLLEGVTELPPPSGARSVVASAIPLAGYVIAQLDARPPQSALLAAPSRLQPVRAPCGDERQPVILLDLDPQGSTAPLAGAAPGDPALPAALADLRRRGLAVAWITDRGLQEVAAVRTRLRETGLDPAGQDPIFVQRYPGEDKQERRRALGRTHCVLAIAGDGREDFDDLYLHLRNSAAALQLESLLGQGWFLIANPL